MAVRQFLGYDSVTGDPKWAVVANNETPHQNYYSATDPRSAGIIPNDGDLWTSEGPSTDPTLFIKSASVTDATKLSLVKQDSSVLDFEPVKALSWALSPEAASPNYIKIGDKSYPFGAYVTQVMESAKAAVFDEVYPIGSYAFGATPPTRGTWSEVVGDSAIWLKSTVADGTTIAQELPNIKGSASTIMTLNAAGGTQPATHNGAFSDSVSYTARSNNSTTTSGWWAEGLTTLDASDYNSVYKNQTTTKVQPDAYVMKVWQRTA